MQVQETGRRKRSKGKDKLADVNRSEVLRKRIAKEHEMNISKLRKVSDGDGTDSAAAASSDGSKVMKPPDKS